MRNDVILVPGFHCPPTLSLLRVLASVPTRLQGTSASLILVPGWGVGFLLALDQSYFHDAGSPHGRLPASPWLELCYPAICGCRRGGTLSTSSIHSRRKQRSRSSGTGVNTANLRSWGFQRNRPPGCLSICLPIQLSIERGLKELVYIVWGLESLKSSGKGGRLEVLAGVDIAAQI